MKKLLAYFDKNISLDEFDKQIPKLVNNFPKSTQILISLKQNVVKQLENNLYTLQTNYIKLNWKSNFLFKISMHLVSQLA